MFATSALTVFTVDVDLDGGGAPEILLSLPTDSLTKHGCIYKNAVGLLQESLVSVGRPSDKIIFSSPPMKAWSDVLKWLPTHTVVPLMCVCQAWRAMIKSDRFIQLHATLHANMGKKPPWLTLIAASHGIFWPLEEGRDREIQQYDMLKFLFTGRESRVVCSKPCHGLVVGSCINGCQMSWDFICNPTMGYYKQLHLDPDGDASFFDGRIGLGCDSRVNKHVLVRLVYRERDLNSWDYHLGCYVRHMDTEMWRAIKPPPRPVAEMQSIHVDGKLYWMVDPDLGTEFSSGCEMLVLDISSEEFTVLEGPECYYDQVKSIVELQGNICVVCSDDIRNAMDIWMLEGGVWFIWCRIELEELSAEYSEETVVLEVDPTDGRLLLNTGKVIGYYDPMTRTIETIHRLVGRLRALKFAPVLCQESLISPYIRVETAMLL